MRGQRSGKFAEYTATYAILKRIGLHQTVLIEKRDASVGHGVYVRDACDSGTPLLVVPSRHAFSLSTVQKLGARVRQEDLMQSPQLEILNRGVLSRLLGCTAGEWISLAWRLAIEHQRSLSPWWGWLNVLPRMQDFRTMEDESGRQCRLHRVQLLPYFIEVQSSMQEEICSAYEVLSEKNLMPSPNHFRWAVDVILTRSHRLPACWTNGEGSSVELGIIPFVDLVNGDDGGERRRNARVEVAFEVEELPRWYRDEFLQESERRHVNGEEALRRLLEEHFFALVALERDLTASEEVIMEYELVPWVTGALSHEDDLLLGRLLRYRF